MEDKRIVCLNAGSGRDYRNSTTDEKWVNVDQNPKVNPDVVAPLEDLSQLADDTFDEVRLCHVWEHCDDLIRPMEELWRVMKHGARLVVQCPYYTNVWAWGDPTHKHAISEHTFMFLNYPAYESNAKRGTSMSQLFPKCDFDIKRIVKVPCAGTETFKDEAFAIKHYFNVIEEIQVELLAVKPLRHFDISEYQKSERASG